MTDFNAFSDIVSTLAGPRASGLKVDNGQVSFVLDVAAMDAQQRDELDARLRTELQQAGAQSVRIVMTAERIAPRLIAVASGKGGVGKSTLSTNLAVAMALAGRSVGLVDADIYGPSQPRLMGAEDSKPEAEGNKLFPVKGAGGVPFLSMGQLAKPGQAIAWRGPMAGNALSQLVDAHWGNVRDIVVDMPPGTGDIQLSMIQKHKPMGAVIISTPQDLALMDAARAIGFFDRPRCRLSGSLRIWRDISAPIAGK